MIQIQSWINQFLQVLHQTFPNRVWFVGLQGSYRRGEATENSDIDMVVILDVLTPADLRRYQDMLDILPHRELLCGFLSGKEELLHWEASDLFQFYHDTQPIQGSLDALLPLIDKAAVSRAIHTGLCNLYHGCVHNMLYEKDESLLRGLYKSASFVVQAMYFQKTGVYLSQQTALAQQCDGSDKAIIDTFLSLKAGAAADFAAMSEALFTWCQAHLEHLPAR